MNKRKIRARTYSLEVLRIMRFQELNLRSRKITALPDHVIKSIEESRRQIESRLAIPFSGIDDLFGIIRYGKRGKDYYKPRRNGRKGLHQS